MNTDTGLTDIQTELNEEKAQNAVDAQEVDALFADKKEREKQIEQLEYEIEQVLPSEKLLSFNMKIIFKI